MGAGFLASGAAATDDVVAEAAIPFDRRRHGMIIGMGAAGLVVESAESARERGIQPICEVLSAVTANSAFHGTRLDVQHISQVMEDLVSKAEARGGIHRHEIAPQTVFISHETYTPARGGSAAAEIHALRSVFGDSADKIVIANTKGFTGHAMGAGVEDVLAVKSLETGVVPPVANFKEVDPELGTLNLSKGGVYPVEYALRLGAGFGSQISMTLLRWTTTKDGVRRSPNALGYAYRVVDTNAWNAWLSRMAGRPAADLEVVHRTLRVHDQVRDQVRDRGAAPIAKPASELRAAARVPTPQVMAPPPVVNTRPPDKKPAKSVSAAPVPPVQMKVQAAAIAPPVPAPVPPPAAKTESEVKITTSATTLTPANKDSAGDPVKERILALAAEKTGYPQDMLDLDLDLEADLGVDTVKQAEMFAGIREIYNIPRDENRKLRDYPTLAHVIRFVYDKRPDLAVAAPAPATPKATEEIEAIAPAHEAAPLVAPAALLRPLLRPLLRKPAREIP